MQDTQEPKS